MSTSYLAQRMASIEASGIRRIWALAASRPNPVNFSIGQPDFDAPEAVKAAAIEAIRRGQNGYTLTAGLPQLQEAIAEQVEREFGWTRPAVLVSSGLSGALLVGLMATINPGDGVLFADPYFVSYRHLVNLLGGQCQYIDTYPDFSLAAERIEAALQPNSKVMIVNSPANPTGAVYSADQLREAADLAGRNDVLVFSDEIYKDFSYDGPAESIARYYERTVVMRGFSKSYGVTGWRLGYLAAPEPLRGLIEAMATLQQYTFVCAPHPFQQAALTALQTDVGEPIRHYAAKRDMIYEGLKDHFDLVRPAGAFYAFVRAPQDRATPFVERAIEHDVLVIPGSVFSRRDSHFRLSYATGDERIQTGIERLCRLAQA
ncbi:MAG: aminotransferase class I/II-fold pyridoxal phosphate-dependent enzyme [Sedimentisphaerales bacterium]|nr:aminotransferase class I/II-fold pyridoxal phosphate-dependent enzyme [Sedimentisphaerales bacterium]